MKLDHIGDPFSWLLMFLQAVGTIEHVSNLALKINNNKKSALGMFDFGLGTGPVLSGVPGIIHCVPKPAFYPQISI